MSKSEAIRSAVRSYLSLLSLKSEDRLRLLQLINELAVPSRKGSVELMEEIHKEEEER